MSVEILAEWNDGFGSDFRVVKNYEPRFRSTTIQVKMKPPVPTEGSSKRSWFVIQTYYPRIGFEGTYEAASDVSINLAKTAELNEQAIRENWSLEDINNIITDIYFGEEEIYPLNGSIFPGAGVWTPEGDEDVFVCIPYSFLSYKLYDPQGIADQIYGFLREFDWNSIQDRRV